MRQNAAPGGGGSKSGYFSPDGGLLLTQRCAILTVLCKFALEGGWFMARMRREHKSTPKVIGGTLYHDTGAVRLDTPEWREWLDNNTTFYFELPEGGYTLRKERKQRGGDYWHAYKQAGGHLRKKYVGKAERLTFERLQAIGLELL